MSVVHLADRSPVISPGELIGQLVPPPRFDRVRFGTYRPDPAEPSQQAALDSVAAFADRIGMPRRRGLFRRGGVEAGATYLDGGFGVGKTHLLASLWQAVPAPKVYGTFVEFTHLVGAVGFGETVRRLSGTHLVAVDEFELDDPGDTMLMTRLLCDLSDSGVALAATSNTLPDRLGEGRFAADDFRREIHSLSSRFTTVRIDGPDYRHRASAEPPDPMADSDLRRLAAATPGASLDSFDELSAKLAALHPSRYGKLLDGVEVVSVAGVRPIDDQAVALRWVVLIDRLYDRTIGVRASGVRLDRLFTPEMLRGGYRKKYLRATSRLLALAREAN